jgi:hypothetical protein
MYLQSSATIERARGEQSLLHAEMYATEFGWRVFPCHSINDGICTCRKGAKCKSPGKHPRTPNGVNDATTDLNTIRQWAERWPDANWAIATGHELPGGGYLAVVDVDPRNGGNDDLSELEAEAGRPPRGHVVRTGGDGLHVFVTTARKTPCRKLAPGIDFKGVGGYVIAAPSKHVSGNPYQWQTLTMAKPAKLPKAWAKLVAGELPVTSRQAGAQQQAAKPVLREILSVRLPDTGLGSYPPETGLLAPFTGVGKRVWAAARRCVVDGSGQTNHRFPALATSLKNIPELRDVPAEALLPVIHWWYVQGRDSMNDNEWESVKGRWLYLGNEWSKPGIGPAWTAAAVLQESGAINPNESAKEVLTLLCDEIQQQAGNGIWYLSCRTAADVLTSLGFKMSHDTSNRLLRQLVADGFLVKPSEHVRGSLWAQRFQTAAAVAACEEHEQLATVASSATAPRWLRAPVQPLAFLKNAGRDEPEAQFVATALATFCRAAGLSLTQSDRAHVAAIGYSHGGRMCGSG